MLIKYHLKIFFYCILLLEQNSGVICKNSLLFILMKCFFDSQGFGDVIYLIKLIFGI